MTAVTNTATDVFENSPVSLRLQVLTAELSSALGRTDASDIAVWLVDTTHDLGSAVARRATNITSLVGSLARRVSEEFEAARFAFNIDYLGCHLEARTEAAGDSLSSLAQSAGNQVSQLWDALKGNPQDVAPKLLSAVFLSLVVSGGPDGDGGAPDLDLMFGIGAHRSILSHSILMGSALETAFLSLLRLVRMVHKNLPAEHDPIWDEVVKHADAIIEGAVLGSGIGMAYHLCVDGTVQRAAFHGLGFSMPMAGHQTLILTNSLAEAVDLPNKSDAVSSGRPAPLLLTDGAATRTPSMALAETSTPSGDVHRALLRTHAELSPFAAALMPALQAQTMRRYGAWLSALAVGELVPTSAAQEHFVLVARFEAEPQTHHEEAWVAYVLAWLALVLTSRPSWSARMWVAVTG